MFHNSKIELKSGEVRLSFDRWAFSLNSNGTNTQIDLSNYKDELYMLFVTDNKGYRTTKKLIKVK